MQAEASNDQSTAMSSHGILSALTGSDSIDFVQLEDKNTTIKYTEYKAEGKVQIIWKAQLMISNWRGHSLAYAIGDLHKLVQKQFYTQSPMQGKQFIIFTTLRSLNVYIRKTSNGGCGDAEDQAGQDMPRIQLRPLILWIISGREWALWPTTPALNMLPR